MSLTFIRIDDRLIHGQVIVGWVPVLEINHIIVADDLVAADPAQKMLYEMVTPAEVKVSVLSLEAAAQYLQTTQDEKYRTLLLFSRPSDVVSYRKFGGPVKSVNIGGMRYEAGKHQISGSISVDETDIKALKELNEAGIELEGRSVPSDTPLDITKLI
jgi:mannose/fructose/sorbose-specific phosphotransferase system IIB component